MDLYLTLSTVLTGTAAAGWLVANALRDHDWRKCSCGPCSTRRENAWQRQRSHIHQADVPQSTRHGFISTTLLQPGMHVGLNGTRYYVREVRTDADGYLIGLTNTRTGNRLVSTVSFAKAWREYWEPM